MLLESGFAFLLSKNMEMVILLEEK